MILTVNKEKKKKKTTMFQMQKKKKNQEIVCLFFTEFGIVLRVHGVGKVKHDSKNKPNKTINKDL